MKAMSALPLTPGETIASVSRSHVGLVRAINEDRVLDCAAARLWAVADGMGGHRGGDLAAQTAIDALRGLIQQGQAVSLDNIQAAFSAANAAIVDRNRNLHENAGTTIVAATIVDRTARIAWVGDSRAYRVRGGRMELLTHDHSVVQELIDAGLLTEQMAEQHPQANVVTRALGVSDSLEIATVSMPIDFGDSLLLCSDGLSRKLSGGCHIDGTDINRDADALLADALRRDGSDNTSLVLVKPF